MRKILLALVFALVGVAVSAQAVFKTNVTITKTTPTLLFNGTGGILNFNSEVYFTHSSGLVTLSGGDFSIGTRSLLGSGSIGATGSRLTKAWLTDLEITNYPTVGGVSLGTTLSGKQDALVSGSNIKTVGGISLLGSGDISVAGAGTVTSFAVTTANGVSATVANPTTAANATFSLGAITPTSVNGVALSGTSTPTLAVTGTTAVSGSNTGDNATNSQYSGLVSNANHSGDATGSTALTIATGAVTLAKMANMATSSLIYRKTTGSGAPEVNTLATLKTDLGLTGTNSGDQTNITGNAATATALQTGRTINNQTFDGTANISINHNDLLNIQGGQADQYYHLTNIEWVRQGQAATSLLNGYLSSTDWNTFNGKLSPNGSAANLTDFPTLNQSTTGSAGSLKSPSTTGVIQVTGMGTGETRVKTVRDANDTFLELNGSYTPAGTWNWSSASVTWPTFNQSTTGNAATVTGFTPASGSLTLSGADALTLTTTAATNVTLPTSGTLATTQNIKDSLDAYFLTIPQ